MAGVPGVGSYSGRIRSLGCSGEPVADGSLRVEIDAEGVVRCPELGEHDAVLLGKDVLEKLLTETYGMALVDKRESSEGRL